LSAHRHGHQTCASFITEDEPSEVRNYETEIAALKEELESKTRKFNMEQRAWRTERVRFIELITHVGTSLALRYEEIAALSKVVTEYSGREEELEQRILSLNSEFGTEISDLERTRDNFEKLAAENPFEYGADVNNVDYSMAGQENEQNVFMWVQPDEPIALF
jgi:chromosome segregation ATPase